MKNVFLIAFLMVCSHVYAQPLAVPVNIQNTYNKHTRDKNGKPGENYWQNTASYNIDVSFNPQTLLIKGTEEIVYTNNSPDTLHEIVFKLYPNLYKKGAQRLMPVKVEDLSEGMEIDSCVLNAIVQKDIKTDGTNMTLQTVKMAPGSICHFSLAFHYTLNRTSHIRTGEIEPGAAFVAYFFPRIAVYDDIDGWNKYQYLGTQEFYNDFCNFKVNITLPPGYVAWATGDLTNAKDVLQAKYYERLQQAERQDSTTTIIDSTDIYQNVTTNNHTWHFEANNVTDFVFAVSNHYMWQSTSLVVDKTTGRRTRVDAVFNAKHKDYLKVCSYARKTVQAMSFSFPAWPYPYPHETVFDGLDQMEYPMMVNDNPLEETADAIELTDHEIFHTMFPFYMGINETKYGWMDEGWATIGEWLISPMIDSSIVDEYGISNYENIAGTEEDQAIITLTTNEAGKSFFNNSYPKPALGYLYVKDLLGDALFTKALHHYIDTWQGKHPMPYDFFNCMNAGSGKDLNWFWKQWFCDNGVPDLAISQVRKKRNEWTITISNKSTKPIPVDVTVIYSDNSTTKLHKSIACWQHSNTTALSFTTTKHISKISLGSTYTPDVNKTDNVYIP